MQLDETVIVLTGATGGIGEEMAKTFVAHGGFVVCAARSVEKLDERLREDEAVHSVPTDIRSWNDVRRMADAAIDAFGRIDALVNNAGVAEKVLLTGSQPSTVDLPVDAWRTIVDTNLTGAFLCTKAVLPAMLDAGSGRILHISSGMGQTGRANRAAYVASKFGLEGFHQSLADELRGSGVASLVLDPGGGVDTENFSRHLSEEERAERLDPSVVVQPAATLLAGHGTNGDRFIATEDF